MIAILTSLAAKVTEVNFPWKWILAGLLTFAVTATISAGYAHVESLQKDLEKAQAKYAQEHVLRQSAEARADEIKKEHDDQVARIDDLEHQRTQIQIEVAQLREQLQNANIAQDIQSNDQKTADAALKRLNARNGQLNRLLKRATRPDQLRPGQDSGSQTVAPGSDNPVQRALQTLWKNGVPPAQ
jgi:TolA-binding protein